MKKLILKILPIFVIGSILFSSSYMFNLNKQQTYERVRTLKESQVQVIATQMDTISEKVGEPLVEDPINEEMMIRSVESINEQAGVYCYLFSKDCTLLSRFSKQQKHETGEQLIRALKEQTPQVLLNHGFHGYITVDLMKQKDVMVYWQGIPSGVRADCEYFIVLMVNKEEIQINEAIISCKIMIGILTILLCTSFYFNIYYFPILDKKDRR